VIATGVRARKAGELDPPGVVSTIVLRGEKGVVILDGVIEPRLSLMTSISDAPRR